jgi:hypothetical protein
MSDDSLHDLKIEVAEELALAEATSPEDAANVPMEDWVFDPAYAQREVVGLRSLMGAVQSLETP